MNSSKIYKGNPVSPLLLNPSIPDSFRLFMFIQLYKRMRTFRFLWDTITHLDMSPIPSMLGYCFVQMGRSGDNPAEKKAHYLLAVGEYIKAGHMLPEDDEKHCCASKISHRRTDVQLNM